METNYLKMQLFVIFKLCDSINTLNNKDLTTCGITVKSDEHKQ